MILNGDLTKRGLEININDIKNKYDIKFYKTLLKKFIIRYKSPVGTYYIEKKNYTIDKENSILILPRFAIDKLLSIKFLSSINNKIPNGISIDCTFLGEPTYNQKIVSDYIMNNHFSSKNVNNGTSGLTLQMTAGSGKTFLAMNILNILKKKTLIIVPNEYLLKQWVDLLDTFFDNIKIGKYYGKKKEDGDIVVGIINSLVSDIISLKINKKLTIEKHYSKFFKEFGLIILDESHIYCTDHFKKIYNRFQSTYMLGLSATPNERVNKCDIISHLNIGHVLEADKIENYKKENLEFKATVNIIKYNGPEMFTKVHINDKTGMVSVPHIIDDIISDYYRNKLILDIILELFELKLNVFIFSERRSHLEYLYEEFNNLLSDEYINNISIPELNINKNIVLYGNSSNEDIEHAKQKSNLIFTTYAYSSTGVSINRMTAMILATPRRSKSTQIIGRIFRLNEENRNCERIIYDIVDNKSVLKNQVYSRLKAYRERNCKMQKKEINYKNIIL